MRIEYRPRVAEVPLRDRLTDPFVQFAQGEANGGILLAVCAIIATALATALPNGLYEGFWDRQIAVAIEGATAKFTLRHAVQDGLMVLFFFLMGLEIKREIVMGELRTVRKAALPVICALGGMAVPAVVYLLAGGPTKGFGIPMATDIAFALGALSLLGKRVPTSLKIFLAAVAIVDDLGAIAIIALFYGHGGQPWGFGLAGAAIVVMGVMNRFATRSLFAWLLVGVACWAGVLASGVHATVAGVIVAAFLPVRTRLDPVAFRQAVYEGLAEFDSAFPKDAGLMTARRQESVHEIERAAVQVQMPLERAENAVGPWVNFFIMPLFALSSAGIDLGSVGALGTTGTAVMAGLLIGKPLGLVGAAFLAVRLQIAELPKGVRREHVFGVGLLAAIGFTMSLFVAELAFGRGGEFPRAQAAVVLSSVLAGTAGVAWLGWVSRRESRSW